MSKEKLEHVDNAIRNCRFRYRCHMRWESLTPTLTGNVRHCSVCNDNVYYCESESVLAKAMEENLCVCIPINCVTEWSVDEESPQLDDVSQGNVLVGYPAPTITEEEHRLAALWKKGSRLTRRDIFGPDDDLRPQQYPDSELNQEIDIPALGMVGSTYQSSGIAFISVNPAGGKPTSKHLPSSGRIYEHVRRLRDSETNISDFDCFRDVCNAFELSIPDWNPIWAQCISPVLAAARASLEEVSYLYLVPFRTRGDAGSQMADKYLRKGYERLLIDQLDALKPGVIVCLDSASQIYAQQWVRESGGPSKIYYLTRKRDAHAERKALISKIKEDFRNEVTRSAFKWAKSMQPRVNTVEQKWTHQLVYDSLVGLNRRVWKTKAPHVELFEQVPKCAILHHPSAKRVGNWPLHLKKGARSWRSDIYGSLRGAIVEGELDSNGFTRCQVTDWNAFAAALLVKMSRSPD